MSRTTVESWVAAFTAMPSRDKTLAAGLLGPYISADNLYDLLAFMPADARDVFFQQFCSYTAEAVFPVVVREAVRVALAQTNAVRPDDSVNVDELRRKVEAKAEATIALIGEDYAGRLLSEYKAKRNRRSDPETIRRNAEIVRLRREDPNLWSHGKLAKKFDVGETYIERVLKHSNKWLQKEAELTADS